MKYWFLLLLCAFVFLVCFLVDLLLKKLFPKDKLEKASSACVFRGARPFSAFFSSLRQLSSLCAFCRRRWTCCCSSARSWRCCSARFCL